MRFSRKEIKGTTNNKTETDEQTHCTKADYISARHSLLVRIFYDIPDLWRPSTQSKQSKLELSSCQDGYGQHKAKTIRTATHEQRMTRISCKHKQGHLDLLICHLSYIHQQFDTHRASLLRVSGWGVTHGTRLLHQSSTQATATVGTRRLHHPSDGYTRRETQASQVAW